MKTLLLVAALFFLIAPKMFGDIRNGYEKDIALLKVSLQSLKDMLAGNQKLSRGEKLRIKQEIKRIQRHLIYHEITETLLRRFSSISPQLYWQINELKDAKGRSVDVYVKFLPEDTPMESTGLVSLRPSDVDSTACSSEHGMASASVKIRVSNKALKVLAHEFGHLSYIVPNLRSYMGYYRSKYTKRDFIGELGHLHGDPSGKSAYSFEKRFGVAYLAYLKTRSFKDSCPMNLVGKIQRSVVHGVTAQEISVVRGW